MDVLCNPQVAPTLRFFSVHARFEPKALLQMSWARSLNNNDEFTSRQTGCRFTILTGSRDRAGSYLPTIRNGSWADLCAIQPINRNRSRLSFDNQVLIGKDMLPDNSDTELHRLNSSGNPYTLANMERSGQDTDPPRLG